LKKEKGIDEPDLPMNAHIKLQTRVTTHSTGFMQPTCEWGEKLTPFPPNYFDVNT
jgi:hypothetical protein